MKTTRYNVTYFLGQTPYQERVDVDSKLDFIDGCGEAMERVQEANPTATDLIANVL